MRRTVLTRLPRWLRQLNLPVAVMLSGVLLLLLMQPGSVGAEGSRELTDSGGNRPFTEYRGPIYEDGTFLNGTNPTNTNFLDARSGPSTSPPTLVSIITADDGVPYPNDDTYVTGDRQRRTLVYVYAEAGEYILLGSSSVGVQEGAIGFVPPGGDREDIVFFDPSRDAEIAYPPSSYTGNVSGSSYPKTDFGAPATERPCGKINSLIEEIGVPNLIDGNAATVDTGYNACIIEVSDYLGSGGGVFEIHLIPPDRFQQVEDTANPYQLDARTDWETAGSISGSKGDEQRSDVPYTTGWEALVLTPGTDPFDYDYAPVGVSELDFLGISVPGGDGIGDVEFGRVWSNYYAFNMGNNFQDLSARFFVITDTGARYLVDLNQLDPFGFIFLSNNKGNLASSSGEPIYRSLQFIGPNVGQIYPDGDAPNNYNIHSPTGFAPEGVNPAGTSEWRPGDALETLRNVTNKLFLRQISEDIPETNRRTGANSLSVGTVYKTSGGGDTTWGRIVYVDPDLPVGSESIPVTPPTPPNEFVPATEALELCTVAPTCPSVTGDPDGLDGDDFVNKPFLNYRPFTGPTPGGKIYFTNVDNDGIINSYTIVLDIDGPNGGEGAPNGIFGDGNDRTLTALIDASSIDGDQVVNVVTWDGLDEAGNTVPDGLEFRIRLFYNAGEVHFPYFDVERHTGSGSGTYIHRIRPVRSPAVSIRQYLAVDTQYTALFYDDRYNFDGTPGTYDFSPCAAGEQPNVNTEDWPLTYNVSSDAPDNTGVADDPDSRCQGDYPTSRAPFGNNPRFALASPTLGIGGGGGSGTANDVNLEPFVGVRQFDGGSGFGFGNRRALDLWTYTRYQIATTPDTPTNITLLNFSATTNPMNTAWGLVLVAGSVMVLIVLALAWGLRRRFFRQQSG